MENIVAGPFRFHLAEDRVRDLLMGTNLYGNDKLAFRELYQNGIDACRRADARLEYLKRTGALLPAKPTKGPRVRIEQGVTVDGQPYVDCIDTGSGMNVEEIAMAFCQAGIRGEELSDAQHELHAFASLDPPVTLWTNSRFGIGALSYFMIASSIEITTVRLESDGSLGPELQARIDGPEEEFHITDTGRVPTVSGTTVRLVLKVDSQVNAVSTLRELVLVAPYDVTAQIDNGFRHEWRAGEFNAASTQCNNESKHTIRDPGGLVWWCGGPGLVLADGIATAATTFGAHLNLTGQNMPRLTADRQRIVEFDADAMDRILLDAVPSALITDSFTTESKWLNQMFAMNHDTADAIVAGLAERQMSITKHGLRLPVGETGFCAHDEAQSDLWSMTRSCYWAPSYHGLPVSEWPKPLAARPTDAVFLGRPGNTMRKETEVVIKPWRGDALSIYRAERNLAWPIAKIITRARELGVTMPEYADELPESSDLIRACVAQAVVGDDEDKSLELQDEHIPAFALYLISIENGIPLAEVLAELDRRYIPVQPEARQLAVNPPSDRDLRVISLNGDGVSPWIGPEQISLKTLVATSESYGLPSGQVNEIFHRLGLSSALRVTHLPDEEGYVTLSEKEARLLSSDLDGIAPYAKSPYLYARQSRNPPREESLKLCKHDASALEELYRRFRINVDSNRPSFKAATTFTELLLSCYIEGVPLKKAVKQYGLHDLLAKLPHGLDSFNFKVTTMDFDGNLPLRDPRVPVSIFDIALGAHLLRKRPQEVFERFQEMGFTIEADPTQIPKLSKRDVKLVSVDFDGRPRWLGEVQKISASRCLHASSALEISCDEVAERYTKLGLLVEHPRDVLPTLRPGDSTTTMFNFNEDVLSSKF